MAIKLLIFDVDGTLVKTDPLLFKAFSQVFVDHLNFPADTHSPDQLRKQFQGSLPKDIFEQVVKSNNAQGRFSYERDFGPYYNNAVLDLMSTNKLEVPEHLRETFNRLDKDRFTKERFEIAAISNSLYPHVEQSLKTIGLWNHPFSADNIWTPDKSDLAAKADPAMIHAAMKHFGITDPQDVVFVGDTAKDRDAALAAGCHIIYTPILMDEVSVEKIAAFWGDGDAGRLITDMSQLPHEIRTIQTALNALRLVA